MTKANNFSVKIGGILSIIGAFIFFVPFKGAQKTTYALFFLTGLLYSFLIQEALSWEYRGKFTGNRAKDMLKLSLLIGGHIVPTLFVMAQGVTLFLIFRKHESAMEDKDASGNLPPILKTYNNATFTIFVTEMILLYLYTSKVLRDAEHPSDLMKMIEKALMPGFVALGTLGCLFIGLLYTVITRYLTDG